MIPPQARSTSNGPDPGNGPGPPPGRAVGPGVDLARRTLAGGTPQRTPAADRRGAGRPSAGGCQQRDESVGDPARPEDHTARPDRHPVRSATSRPPAAPGAPPGRRGRTTRPDRPERIGNQQRQERQTQHHRRRPPDQDRHRAPRPARQVITAHQVGELVAQHGLSGGPVDRHSFTSPANTATGATGPAGIGEGQLVGGAGSTAAPPRHPLAARTRDLRHRAGPGGRRAEPPPVLHPPARNAGTSSTATNPPVPPRRPAAALHQLDGPRPGLAGDRRVHRPGGHRPHGPPAVHAAGPRPSTPPTPPATAAQAASG